jgi:hypothetical protein
MAREGGDAMKENKRFMECCVQVEIPFDDENRDYPLTCHFVYEAIPGYQKRHDAIFKLLEETRSTMPSWVNSDRSPRLLEDAFGGVLGDVLTASFAVGVACGQMFEMTDERAKKSLEYIKKVIREEKLFPLVPTEGGEMKWEVAGKPHALAARRPAPPLY